MENADGLSQRAALLLMSPPSPNAHQRTFACPVVPHLSKQVRMQLPMQITSHGVFDMPALPFAHSRAFPPLEDGMQKTESVNAALAYHDSVSKTTRNPMGPNRTAFGHMRSLNNLLLCSLLWKKARPDRIASKILLTLLLWDESTA